MERWLRRVLAIGLGAALGTPVRGQPEGAAAPEIDSAFTQGAVELEGGAKYGYRLLTPPEDAEAPEGGWPLVVFLHGAGERGDDNRSQLRHFPERMASAEHRERFPCYLLAVQCPEGEIWADFNWRTGEADDDRAPALPMQAVMQAVESLVAEKPIDLTRIYLTGLSMGGFGSWDLAARKPDWFAAVVPICGGGRPEKAGAYKGLPIWAWHDEGDEVVPVELSRKMVEAAREAGAAVRYDEITGHGHASWVPAYDPDKAPAWMFAQRRAEASGELLVRREGE
jgi:predicted peptidase